MGLDVRLVIGGHLGADATLGSDAALSTNATLGTDATVSLDLVLLDRANVI